jgi:hypothetical protein
MSTRDGRRVLGPCKLCGGPRSRPLYVGMGAAAGIAAICLPCATADALPAARSGVTGGPKA